MPLEPSLQFGDRQGSAVFVDWVSPEDVLGFFDRLDVEIDDHGFLINADEHAVKRLVAAVVDFPMWLLGGTRIKSPDPASATYSRFSPQRMLAMPLRA